MLVIGLHPCNYPFLFANVTKRMIGPRFRLFAAAWAYYAVMKKLKMNFFDNQNLNSM
jgi:hypothetical protein